jgi:ribosomal protein L18
MQHTKKVEKLKFIDSVIDVRGCHMNQTNNQIVAQIIFENQDTDVIVNTFLDKRLNYDPNELCKMIDDYDRKKNYL